MKVIHEKPNCCSRINKQKYVIKTISTDMAAVILE